MARACNCIRAPGQPKYAGGPCFTLTTFPEARSAFTLVELMVGVGVLAVTIVALYGAFSFGFSTIKLSQEEVRADQILVQKLETLRVYNWTNIINNYMPTNFPEWFSTNGGVSYAGSINVTPFVPTAANESYSDTLRQVTVTVGWISGGVPRTRSMTTFVSQYGIQNYKP
jgi:prepilin-type N-terminal cleavage/methylation domain-containing protein